MFFIDHLINKPSFEIVGEICRLKPLTKKDFKKVCFWFEDLDLVQFAFGVVADEKVLGKIAKDYLKNFFSTSTEILGIYQDDDKLLGFVNYSLLRYRETKARIGILIATEENRSKGLGTSALNMALLYLFDRRNIDKIELDTAYFNKRAQRCFEKCGFIKTREITDVNFISGEIVHKFLMELKREDFFKTLYDKFNKLPVFYGRVPKSQYLEKNT